MLGLNDLTLSVAESCTGGLVAERLTAIPNISRNFIGGAVVYSDALKTKFAGVPEATLQQYGAISAEVARALADGIRLTTNSSSASASQASPARPHPPPAPTRASPSASSTSAFPMAKTRKSSTSNSPATANASASGFATRWKCYVGTCSSKWPCGGNLIGWPILCAFAKGGVSSEARPSSFV